MKIQDPHAFEVDNAKQLSVEKTVSYFVPSQEFERLFTGKNHILLGSRGSGKTTWVRMLAHDHVVIAAKRKGTSYDYARDALRRNLIGIYVPTNIGLVGSLRNKPWQSDAEAEQFFQWRLNLHSCAALIPIIRSCIANYVIGEEKQLIAELQVCRQLSEAWSRKDRIVTTLESLRVLLSTIESDRIDAISQRRARSNSTEEINDYFDADLFLPIRHAITVMSAFIGVPDDAVWMLCIDEAEYLTEVHHKILNTHLRTAAGNLVFKIATMPFAHHTLDTNAGDPVREGHDFEYVFVDQDAIDSRGSFDDGEFLKFAREVFKRRVSGHSRNLEGITLAQLLGGSLLIDEKATSSDDDFIEILSLIERHANEPTFIRAKRLLETDTRKFRNEILRKMHGALLLREALAAKHGNSRLRVYSGERMVVRCSDGNPRRLMRLLNAMLKKVAEAEQTFESVKLPLDSAVQNEVLETIARDTLRRVQSEPPDGASAYKTLMAIGRYMERVFGARRLGSDFISSIEVAASDGEMVQRFVKHAVQLSLLTPSRDNAHNGPNAPCEGVFHLAFLFAPLFSLLPRRNKAQRLPKILAEGGQIMAGQQQLLEI